MLMKNENNLRKMLTDGYVIAPCIYDCLSARSAELCGFKATMLSGCALAWSMIGMPDVGLLTADELIYATTRITDSCPLPLLIDADEGYGDSPLNVYRTCKRLVKAGAAALQLDDSTAIRGYERIIVGGKHPIMDEITYAAKIRAAVKACEGSDCFVIGRTIALRKLGLDQAIKRCQIARDEGAEMTLVLGLNAIDDCVEVANKVQGWKMYPDITTKNGKADVSVQDIVKLGFNLITMHYTEYGAMYGMMLYGKENAKNENCVFSDVHSQGGLSFPERMDQLSPRYQEWMKFETDCFK